jgi:hypothetical protein
MNDLFKLILSDKGRDADRLFKLAALIYIGFFVTDVKTRVTNIENCLGMNVNTNGVSLFTYARTNYSFSQP